MFMIDMQGTFDRAPSSRSSRTPGERCCASCIARATRSKSAGLTSATPAALRLPGSLRESSSIGSLRPRIGMRGWGPSGVEVGRLAVGDAGCLEAAGKLARIELDRFLAAPDRHADAGAVGVERLDLH